MAAAMRRFASYIGQCSACRASASSTRLHRREYRVAGGERPFARAGGREQFIKRVPGLCARGGRRRTGQRERQQRSGAGHDGPAGQSLSVVLVARLRAAAVFSRRGGPLFSGGCRKLSSPRAAARSWPAARQRHSSGDRPTAPAPRPSRPRRCSGYRRPPHRPCARICGSRSPQ